MNTNFDMEQVVYVCSVCEETFDSNDTVTCHILNDHSVDKTVKKLRKQLTPRKTSALRSKETVREIKNAIADQQDPKVRKHGTEFYCDICSYKTVYQTSYKRHLLRHEKDGRQHKCMYCSYAAIQKNNLKVHMKTVHPFGAVAPVIVDDSYLTKLQILFST